MIYILAIVGLVVALILLIVGVGIFIGALMQAVEELDRLPPRE